MKTENDPRGLNLSIVFAGLVIGGSLVFFGLQLNEARNEPVKNVQVVFKTETEKRDYWKSQAQGAKDTQSILRQKLAQNLVPPNPTDFVRGNPEAEITVIEYSDYECPFCKRFHPIMQQALLDYPDTLNWIYRDFPLESHDPLATQESIAAQCVGKLGGNDKFWEYTDLIFATTRSNGNGLKLEQLTSLATQIGIDEADLTVCQADPAIAQKVQRSIMEGAMAGVRGTPGNFVLNNKTGKVEMVAGVISPENLDIIIRQLLQP